MDQISLQFLNEKLKFEYVVYTVFIFEQKYSSKRLQNWQVPKWQPKRPRQRKGFTKVISNDRGWIADDSLKRPSQSAWNTYQFHDKISRNFNDLQDDSKIGKYSNSPDVCKEALNISGKGVEFLPKHESSEDVLKFNPKTYRLNSADKQKSLDLEYIPGEYTPHKQQHPTHEFLLEKKYNRDHNIETELPLNRNLLGNHKCEIGNYCEPPPIKFSSLLSKNKGFVQSNYTPDIEQRDSAFEFAVNNNDYSANMPYSQSITKKPNERNPSPVIPAYENFDLAKRMHQNNLDHQPLPDCVADLAFRKLQINDGIPGLALDIEPIATGVAVKTHNAGATHCTKMKVYRPKTAGIVPKAFTGDFSRSYSALQPDMKMGAMDLAICWDYKPTHEPPIPLHIDGSNDSAGPAVFTCVKTPRDDPVVNTGRSAGVFTNTLGETDFFDKDILRRKTDFAGRKIETNDLDLNVCREFPRARSVSRDNSGRFRHMPIDRFGKYQSSPNITDLDYKTLRDKYLGTNCELPSFETEERCKRPSFFKKARSRFCHKVSPEMDCCSRPCPTRMPCKSAFRVGVPRYNAAGEFSLDNGCGIGNHSQRVLVVPQPRNPYSKRNYDINTLVPPFKSYAGGAGEGGYPEHWRLASIYQHSFKPVANRKKPLIQTVFK